MIDNLQLYYTDIINSLSELVQIPTLYEESSVSTGMPYGKRVYQGYLWLREKAMKDGFEVFEYDGHALAIRIPGSETPHRIDVVSHVDVVEPGEGWQEDPFSGTVTSEYVYGRGTQDMKGTLILTYYALKYIKDHRIPCKRELRVVIGCDEERTMGDIKYYIAKAGEPAFAFTPDGKFPYSLGEKGALMWSLNGIADTCIEELDGGVQCNVVSPHATALIKNLDAYDDYRSMLAMLDYQGEVSQGTGGLKLKVYGKAAHASRPEDGLNATVLLLNWIRLVSKDPLSALLYKAFCDPYGRGCDMDFDIEPMGKLTLNLGVLKIKDRKIDAEIDCRYPYGVTSDSLTAKLQSVLEPLNLSVSYDDKPTLADRESPYLRELLSTYRKVTGQMNAQPVISGGVSYSKVIGNCVAFGPMAEGDSVLAHQANERVPLNKIRELFEIYTTAMIQLANLE